jgi:hypothetical protein
MLRELGAIAVRGISEEDSGIEAFVKDDFVAAVEENLKTDAEFRAHVDIEPTRQFAIRNGKVVTADGQTMESVIARGLTYSRRASLVDPRLATQERRDEGDLLTARLVDTLRPGEAYTVVSMDPKDDLARDGRKFWEDKGYRAGLAFIQFYYKDTEGALLTGSYSVERSNMQAWRAVQQRQGVLIPEGTPADDWIRYGDRREMSAERARSYAADLRRDYYREVGLVSERHSVTELIKQRRDLIDAYFNTYMRPLAEAVYTGTANETIQGLVEAFLAQSAITEKLAPESRRELVRVANTIFTPEAGRLVEEMIRYALVEELRKGVARLVEGEELTAGPVADASRGGSIPYTAEQLIMNLSAGLSAGRSYGGCAASLRLGEDDSSREENPQSIFGGRESGGEDAQIPPIIRCVKCGQRSLKQQVVHEKSWRCPHCRYEIDVCTGAVLHGAEAPTEQEQGASKLADLFRATRPSLQPEAAVA